MFCLRAKYQQISLYYLKLLIEKEKRVPSLDYVKETSD